MAAIPGLEIVPYIDGTPAGTARRADAIWLGDELHVDELPKSKFAKRVPEEIGKAFARPDIKAALDYSFERSAEDVRAYFEENFALAPAEASTEAKTKLADHKQDPQPTATGEDIAPQDADDDVYQNLPEDDGALDDADPASEPDWPASGPHEHVVRPRPPRRPARPSIIERFAKVQGFTKESDLRFFHADGSWIARTIESRFPWEHRNAGGDLVSYYWPKEHCLEQEPLQLDADVWTLIDQHPESYALILKNIEGAPVQVTGGRLRAMREAGEVTLYPATYRIVYSSERHA